MDLFIDIGNTSLKWTSGDGGHLGEMQRVRHHGGLPIDLHAAWEQLPAPERVLVVNVAGDTLAAAVASACRSRWGSEPRFVQTQRHCRGVTIAYAQPQRLGVDRWLALLAGHHSCSGAVLIVDAGTAVTYDLLLADGRHLGGLILPGIEMMRDSLLAGTHIPRVEPEELAERWTADTATAIAAGSIQAPAALAERLYDGLAARIGGAPARLVTGGDGERLLPAIDRPACLEPDFVLQGLALLV